MWDQRVVRIMSYVIYEHISPSGKHYIGQTSWKPEKRWGCKGYRYLLKRKDGSFVQRIFANAILRYGWDNFEHRILFTGLSKLDADMIETDLIWYYKKIGKSYNTTLGGEGTKGVKFTDETREKIRKANLGKRLSEETRKRMGEGHSKKIGQYSKDGVFIRCYNSIQEAQRVTGVYNGSISNVALGKRKTAGGYIWRYV